MQTKRSSDRNHFLIATGVTEGLVESVPRVLSSVKTVADLFVNEFGYQREPRLGIDPTAQQMRSCLRNFCAARGPDDVIVFYHTGHAIIEGGRHRLWMGDTTDPYSNTLPTSDLAEIMLADTPVTNLLIVLDACFAGRGGAEALLVGMHAARGVGERNVTLLTAAHPTEQVVAGDFVKLFEQAIRHPATAGHEPPYLSIDAVVGHIYANPSRRAWQTVSWTPLFRQGEIEPFLPNPRYDPSIQRLDVLTQRLIEQNKLRKQDVLEHFVPRAQGVDVPTETDWRFAGRHVALRDLATWLRDPGMSPVKVVTGDPGSGKSAVLGRLVAFSHPGWRSSVPRAGVPEDTIPPEKSINVAVHARGLTNEQVLMALSAAAEVDAESTGEFVREVKVKGRRLIAVIDAIDEAIAPDELVSEVIRPLIKAAEHTGLRFLLATRRHLIQPLGAERFSLDLDAERYADNASLKLYAERCLRDAVPGSPYGDDVAALRAEVASAVAEAAGRSFLVALIVARTLAAHDLVTDPADREWRRSLPATAAEAMHNDLESRLVNDAQRARELLRPLAYAHGAGLPWEDIWAPLASLLSGVAYTNDDVNWLLDNAGSYVVEALEGGKSVYRLYHAALAEYLRRDQDGFAIHRQCVTFFTRRIPQIAPGYRDWARTHIYVRAHLATHAVMADMLDDLMVDGGYLATAVPTGIVAALASVHEDEAKLAATVYQRTLHQLRAHPDERLSYLELWARRIGAVALAAHIAGHPAQRRWTTSWAHWPTEHPHRVLAGHNASVNAVLCLTSGRPSAVTAGSDGTLRVWDLNTVEPLSVHPAGSSALLDVQAAIHADGHGVIVALSADHRIYRWDAQTWLALPGMNMASRVRRLISEVLLSSAAEMKCAALPEGRLVAVTSGRGIPPLVWDLTTGTWICALRDTKGMLEDIEFVQLIDGRFTILASDKQRAHVWELETGQPLPVDDRGRTFGRVVYFKNVSGSLVAALSQQGRQGLFWDLADNSVFEQISLSTRLDDELRSSADELKKVVARRFGKGVTVVPHEGTLDVYSGRMPKMTYPATTDFTTRSQLDFIRRAAESTHTAPVTHLAMAVLADGRTVMISTSGDGTARLWDVDTIASSPSAVGREAPPAYRVALATRSANIAIAVQDVSAVTVWDVSTGSLIRKLDHPLVSAVTLHSGDHDELMVALFGDYTCSDWDVASGRCVSTFLTDPSGLPAQAAGSRLRNGTPLALTAGHGTRVLSWNLETGGLHKTFRAHAGWASCVTSGRDGQGRAIAVTGGLDNRIRIWNLERGRRNGTLRVVKPWSFLRSPAEGRVVSVRVLRATVGHPPALVVLSEGGTVRIFDMRRRKLLGRLAVNADLIDVGVLPGGLRVLITVTDKGLLAVWELRAGPANRLDLTGDPMIKIELEIPIYDLALGADGQIVLATRRGLMVLRVRHRSR